MKSAVYKKFLYVASYMVLALFIEFITFNFMGLGPFPEYFWFDLIFVLFIGMFIFLIPSFRVEAIIIVFLLIVQSALSFVNQAMKHDSMLRTVFTLDQLRSATSVAGVFTNDYVSWPLLIGLVIIVLLQIFFLIYLRRIRVKTQFKKNFIAVLLVFFCFAQSIIGSVYGVVYKNLHTEQSGSTYLFKDDKKLYDDAEYAFKLRAYKRFGTFAFYFKNLTNFLDTATNKEIKSSLAQVDEYFSTEFEDPDSLLSSANGNYTEFTGALAGNNLIMIMIESAEWYGIDKELTPTLYALSTQGLSNKNYISKNKTNQTEATAILGSCPTESDLQSLLQSDVKDNLSSFKFSVPNVFKYDGFTSEEEVYSTIYMHNNTSDFYNRAKSHKALGFDSLYFVENMDIQNPSKTNKNDFYDVESDYKAMDAIVDSFAPTDKKFMSYYTSMCMHGNYNDLYDYAVEKNDFSFDYVEGTSQSIKNTFRNLEGTNDFLCDYYSQITFADFEAKFADSGLFDLDLTYEEIRTIYYRYKQYQAAYMDFDRAIERLVTHLIDNNLMQNTTLVLFADHDGYYHNQNYLLRGLDVDKEYYHLDLYNVPFIIFDGSFGLNYNSINNGNINYDSNSSKKIYPNQNAKVIENSFGGLEINNWSSPYDIVPTILDLFGYSFSLNLYQGTSMFANVEEENRSIMYSLESGILSGDCFVSSEGMLYVKYNNNYYVYNEDKSYTTPEGEVVIHLTDILTGIVLDADSEIREIIEGRITIFAKQYLRFIHKKKHLESIYKYKFFSSGNLKDDNGETLYKNTDISRLIKKI